MSFTHDGDLLEEGEENGGSGDCSPDTSFYDSNPENENEILAILEAYKEKDPWGKNKHGLLMEVLEAFAKAFSFKAYITVCYDDKLKYTMNGTVYKLDDETVHVVMHKFSVFLFLKLIGAGISLVESNKVYDGEVEEWAKYFYLKVWPEKKEKIIKPKYNYQAPAPACSHGAGYTPAAPKKDPIPDSPWAGLM